MSEPLPMYGKEFAEDPASAYRELRRQGPAAKVELAPGVEATLVTGYTEALHVLHTPESFAKDPRRWQALADGRVPADSPVLPMMAFRPNCLFTDGAEHLRLRQAVTDSLNRIDAYELRRFVSDSADYLIAQWTGGQVDLVQEYARMLPLLVFGRLFGCPPELGDRLVAGISGIFEGVDAEHANEVLTRALIELVALKRARPGPDVTSWLMEHPNALDDEEMIHQLVMLMSAGTEPLRNLIAGGLRVVLCDDGFSDSLFGSRGIAVEDALDHVLWNDPPMANYSVHYPVHDVELGGVPLRKGEPLVMSFAAANSELAQAGGATANRSHLAWSAGPHACPARDPAWLIATTAIEKLLNRVPDLELAVPPAELVWRPGPFHRALAALPARFTPQRLPTPQPRQAPAQNSGWQPSAGGGHARPQPGPRRGLWSSFVSWWRGD